MLRRTFLRVTLLGTAAALAGTASACAPAGPRAIAFGRETCAFCRMTVDDPRHAAQLATRTGQRLVFDSVECCAAWAAREGEGAVRTAWVSDVRAAGTLVDVATARFWRAAALTTPMGMGLVATANAMPPVAGAEGPLTWDAVRASVGRSGLTRGSGAHAAHAAHGSTPDAR